MSEDGFAPRFIRRVPPNMSPERAARLAEIDEIFSRDSVYRLTGIGMKRTRALRRAGYPTIESVAAATPAAIAAALGSVRLAKDMATGPFAQGRGSAKAHQRLHRIRLLS